MKLYWGSGSGPCMKVIMVMEELGLWKNGEAGKQIQFSKQEHKGEEIMKLNPRGQVPTLEDGGTVVCESTAACMYLDQKYNKGGLTRVGTDDVAMVLQRVMEEGNLRSSVFDPIMRYKMMTKKEDQDAALLKSKWPAADKELSRWDAYLDNGKQFLVGDAFSLADVSLYVVLSTLDRQGLDLKSLYPNLCRYFEALKSRPSAVAAYPPHWEEGPGPRLLEDFKPERS